MGLTFFGPLITGGHFGKKLAHFKSELMNRGIFLSLSQCGCSLHVAVLVDVRFPGPQKMQDKKLRTVQRIVEEEEWGAHKPNDS